MRHFIASIGLLAFSLTARADDACLGGNCPQMDDAVRRALADVGLTDIDSFTIVSDATGSTRLLLASEDLVGLGVVATLTGSRITYVKGLQVAFLDIPFSGGANTITIGGWPVPEGGVAHTDTNMDGPGSGGSGCYDVCECTEDGLDCWTVCP